MRQEQRDFIFKKQCSNCEYNMLFRVCNYSKCKKCPMNNEKTGRCICNEVPEHSEIKKQKCKYYKERQ